MSIHYAFPIIETIDDVLPHIDDCFRVTKQNGITYINYNHMSPETFPTIKGEWDIRNKVRRECRGIAFGPDGKIVSRPFHKFFNVGEREDTPFLDSDFMAYTVYDKLDGSMIRPVPIEDHFRLATKAGVTQVAMKAEVILDEDITEGIKYSLFHGYTPIFEFTSPENRIVLPYDKPALSLIAIRENVSGEYQPLIESGAELIARNTIEGLEIKNSEDLEGVVIHYANGHMLKLKSDWYVKLHRAKEYLSNEKKLVRMILEDGLDDVLAAVDDESKKKFKRIESILWAEIENMAFILETAYDTIRRNNATKKEYAIATSDDPSPLRSIIFKLWDEKVDNPREAVVQYILSNMGNQEKYLKMKEVLYLSDYTGRVHD